MKPLPSPVLAPGDSFAIFWPTSANGAGRNDLLDATIINTLNKMAAYLGIGADMPEVEVEDMTDLILKREIALAVLQDAAAAGITLTNEQLEQQVGLAYDAIIASQQRQAIEEGNLQQQLRGGAVLDLIKQKTSSYVETIQNATSIEAELALKIQQRNQALADAEQQGALVDQVTKILNGDTFEIELVGQVRHIRLNNADTAELGNAYGQVGRRFSEDFIIDAGEIRISESFGESYERELREVLNESNQNLSEELVREGLALPVSFELSGDRQAHDQLRVLAIQAARAGRGIFENELIQAQFLEGSITTMGDVADVYGLITESWGGALKTAMALSEAYDELEGAQGEYVDGTVDNSGRINEIQALLAQDLTEAEKKELKERLKNIDEFSMEADSIYRRLDADLGPVERGKLLNELADLEMEQGQVRQFYTGNREAAEEAQEDIDKINQEIVESMRMLAFESVLSSEGLTEATIQFGVALGLFDQETADFALNIAQTEAAIKQLVDTSGFFQLSAE